MIQIITKKKKYKNSIRWVSWFATIDIKTCYECRYNHGRIFDALDKLFKKPPVHLFCRCTIYRLPTLPAGKATDKKMEGADWWLKYIGKLPDYYISKEEAEKLGWNSKTGNLSDVAPNKMIGGNVYKNRLQKLPDKPGRIWYEADINYTGGFRNSARVLYSNDGLIFVTYDHYLTFIEIVEEEY